MADDSTVRPNGLILDPSQIPGPGTLTDEHAAYLAAHAVDPSIATALGVRSLTSRADTVELGGVWPNWANFPAILFPWTSPDGRVEYQVRPDTPTEDQRGKARKYVFARDMTPALWAVRPVENPRRVVIIEGTKQCLAGASYAPPGVAVYGMAGCRMWQVDGTPIPDLAVVDGFEVVVILDADAATNPEVYAAGVNLAEALAMEGAEKITFGRLPGGATKSGLDDILAGRPQARRAPYLARIIESAKPKPSDKAPRAKKKGADTPGESGRVTIVVNRDRRTVIDDLTAALIEAWDGRELFNHGGVISRKIDETMTPVDRGTFHDLVQDTAVTVTENEGAQGTTYSFAWPDSGTMSATMSKASKFSPLERIAQAPFVRPDGSIVTEDGYDEATKTLLMMDPVFEGLEVPEDPTPADILAARTLLLHDWLGDFPLDGDADRANLLALLVTPAIRGIVPRAPLAVIDGLQMGVGKNLLADCLLTVYTGHAAQPMNFVDEHDELRKQITAAFRTGAGFFVFDEAHTLEGAPLAQALTAETWQDRILGVSTMANFPNRVTWISLGNNVQVRGDITRRVYRIALRPTYANPQDRPSSSFRHPGQSGLDLGSWTRKNRRELLCAILTLVRAWFAAGSPYPSRGVSFGSFEAWERMTGGIVEAAGLPGFLGNLRVWRSESDFDTQYWADHMAWLRDQFAEENFRTAEVRTKALAVGSDGFPAPPNLDDPAEKNYGKRLGEAYSRNRGRRYGRWWMDRVSSAHGNVSQWRVFEDGDALPPSPGGPATPEPEPLGFRKEGPTPEPDTSVSTDEESRLTERDGDDRYEDSAPYNEHGEARGADESDTRGGETDTDLLAFDLETDDANELYRADPQEFIRIGATAKDDQQVAEYGRHVARTVAADIRASRVATGHNVMAFDLPAIVRSGAMSMPEVHKLAADGRLADALLMARYLDPPMAREHGVDAERKYDLGRLGQTYDLGEKLSDTSKALAKKYGGWGSIPCDPDDPDEDRAADARAFRAYMVQDVELSRRLYRALLDKLGGTMPDYLVREHRVAALAAQISVNGFLVDQTLLGERVAEVDARKADSMALLAGQYGVPTADAKGKPYASPLASKAGKEAVGAALVAAGVPEKALWRTPKSGDLQLSGEAMLHYGREYGQQSPAVREIAKAVYRIVGARSVYQTAHDHLCPDGRVHPKVGFDQATGRWSVTRPGLTVFGKRNGRHVERAIFLPDPGEVLVSFDLSQVDMRAVAGLSQDSAYIEMLLHEDPHAEIARLLFGDPAMREVAKPIGHGWNYGRGIKAISEGNDLDPAIVRQFDRSMYERFGRLVQWQGEVRAIAESGALLDNGFGRLMRPDPRRAHTQGPALMGQGAARDIMMTGLLRLPAEVLPMLRAQIHDEIVLSIPEADLEDVKRAVVGALSFDWTVRPGAIPVPILADGSKAGTDWSLCYAK